ncbi:ABC transporter substrate-binding protein [Rouxiella badensis]|jgi:iron complex transport system substrate-binding protein|uniref:ABC transporter substrate-binding protein n=1 Tax=Rouxiella badensis TaxID=1646377 RepID=A0A1X0WLC4_9GAMM|nr:ABC transporter substrate-binding protein [Rouxiella badensis]MCC3702269.1 ABC transporter substrate-binding protein [Rouxiella badensis]MCC3717275.1 ABC transporter substrate-binding protein [Rouxiella badensis]MCC3728371.1 ABC transporter substrate-binding protein [Rouxiella badensis]MCC3732275.1 ABC transporter substrate-binding protein [Rouxiella badensis]MCC3740115.1 ABC transporter substrate-binding protein [Rouxiella badensis]
MLKKTTRVLSVAGLMAASFATFATTYPLTVTDLAGQKLTINKEPERIIIQDGRDILSLAVLDKSDPFKRVVAWNNLLKNTDSGTWDMLKGKWPESTKILDMGFSDKGQVDLETVIAKKPDLMIAQLRAKQSLQQGGVIDRLNQLHIPIVFVDYDINPAKDTAPSIDLLGKVLNQEKNAQAYTAFYRQHYQHIQDEIASIKNRPNVFIEPLAGRSDSCCFTHGEEGWGKLIEAVGAKNIGSELLPGASGEVSLEKVISMKPDVYIFTGSIHPGKGQTTMMPFGLSANQADVDKEAKVLTSRTGVAQVPAVMDQRVYAVYHQFYNHPYNIVGMEYLAKFIYPQQFKNLDPAKTYHEIIRNYTQLPDKDFIFSWQPKK